MIQVSECGDPRVREKVGLLEFATKEDKAYALETDGKVTDYYRVEASKLFKTPYGLVTTEQKARAKRHEQQSQYMHTTSSVFTSRTYR